MANLNFQQPPRSLASHSQGGAARGFGGGGGHVTPTFPGGGTGVVGGSSAPQQLSPNRSQQLVGSAPPPSARGGTAGGGGSIFAPRSFPADRRPVPGGLGSVMPDWSSSSLGNMGSFGMPPSRSSYSSNSSGQGGGGQQAGGGNNSFHSVFGGGGDSGSTPPVLDLSEFPSLTNRGGGGAGGGGLGGGTGGGQGDSMPPQATTMPGKQPYGPNMDNSVLTTSTSTIRNKARNQGEQNRQKLHAGVSSKNMTSITANADPLDIELKELKLSSTKLDSFGDDFVEFGDNTLVTNNEQQENLHDFKLSATNSLEESSDELGDNSLMIDNEDVHLFKLSTTNFDALEDKKFVKFGDNSIITSHVSPILSSKLTAVSADEPNFLRKLREVCRNVDESVKVIDNNIQVSSLISRCVSRGVSRSVRKTGTVFPVLDAPLDATNSHFLEVQYNWVPVHYSKQVDHALLSPFLFNDKFPKADLFEDAFCSYLRPANRHLCVDMSSELLSNLYFADTCALYAKGVTFALQIDIADFAGTQTEVVQFGDEPVVNYLDLDDVNTKACDWKGYFANASIQLMENEHYDPGDLQVIYWLAKAGHRITGVANSKTNMCHYIKWPSINFLLIRHGAPCSAPDAEMITSLQMISFLSSLASKRAEWDAFCKGIYIALDLVGVQYRTVDGHNYHLSSDYNTCPYKIPYPSDFNFFVRHLKPNIPFSMARKLEVDNFRHGINLNTHAKTAALYTAMRSAMATTLLASYNITTHDIIQYSSSHGLEYAFKLRTLSHIVCDSECWFSIKLRNMFQHFFGLVLDGLFYFNMSWNGISDYYPNSNAQHCLGGLKANLPPFWNSPFIVDDFLLTRPLEWGIVGPDPKVDFKSDVVVGVSVEREGIFPRRGASGSYSECAKSNAPYDFVPYGVQVMNVVLQCQTTNESPTIMYNALTPDPCGPVWSTLQTYTDFIYDADLCCLQPCTLPSYSWEAEEIRAPALRGDSLSEMLLRMLSVFCGQQISFIGYHLKRRPISPFQGLWNRIPRRPRNSDGTTEEEQ